MRGRSKTRAIGAVFAVTALTAGPAAAQEQAPPVPSVMQATSAPGTTTPAWITPPRPLAPAPTPEYRGGLVDLACTSQPTGEVTDCAVTYETPNTSGLGASVLAAVGVARMTARTVNGVAEASPVRFSVEFGYGTRSTFVRSPVPPPPPGEPLLITLPSWARQPMPEYPERAFAQGIDRGRVVLNCGFISNGDLVDCRIVEEEPADVSFGLASIAGARRGRLADRIARDSPLGSRVQFTLRYISPEPTTPPDSALIVRLPGAAPAPAADAPRP